MPPKGRAKKPNEAQTEARCETVLLPNAAVFAEERLGWTHMVELARVFQRLSREEQGAVKLTDWVDRASKHGNPGDVAEGILGGRKLGRLDGFDGSVRALFATTPAGQRAALERRIGGALTLDGSKTLDITLHPPALCKTNALNRTHGAHNLLAVRLADALANRLRTKSSKPSPLQKAFALFATAPIRIGHRLFFLILRKENTLWFMAAESADWTSTKNFLNGVLDLDLNKEMTVAKWVARTALILSDTQSSIDIDPRDIRRVPDLYSDSLIISRELLGSVAETLGLNYIPSCIEGRIRNQRFVWRVGEPGEGESWRIQVWDDQIGAASGHLIVKFQVVKWEPSSRRFLPREQPAFVKLEHCLRMGARTGPAEIMTDGAAIISRLAAAHICLKLERRLEALPAAYQARLAFAKGLWVITPERNSCDVTPWIEVRDSQWKAEPTDDFHYHFNLCRVSREASHCKIGKQLIPMLASRGVSIATISRILEDYIQSQIEDLNTTDPVRLASALTREVRLCQNRRAILGKLAGKDHDPFTYRKFKEDGTVKKHELEYYESKELTTDHLCKQSLAPYRYEDQVINMLASGFEPSNRFIVDKIRKIKDARILNAVKFKIPVPQSAYVYAVPDPTGTLREGEVFLQLSDFDDIHTGIKISTIIGPGLVSRSPCVAPIDARKVQFVNNDELIEVYFDVLVCSIHGNASLLSLLSGGDYDGDQVTVIWHPAIVQEFRNADLEKFPRINVEDYFESVQSETVNECLLGHHENDSEKFVKRAQSILIAGLFTPSDFCFYCKRHQIAEYVLGADHLLTQTLAEVYVKCLDAPKAGTVLKPDKDLLLQAQFEDALKNANVSVDQKPKCFAGSYEYAREGNTHVFDTLLKLGSTLRNKYKKDIDLKDCQTHSRRSNDRDHDLAELFMKQKKLYELDKTVEGSRYIWIGVLRPLQRNLAALLIDLRKDVATDRNLKTQDKIWEAEYGAGTAEMKYIKPSYPSVKKYNTMSYDAAFDFVPDPEDIAHHQIDLDRFQAFVRIYLDGLGPMGYALLKASCLAKLANPEAFAPYDLAFRETCFLKAMASHAKKPMDIAPHHSLSAESHRPPHSITTECYLTNIIKLGVVQGRPAAHDNIEPV